MMLSRDDIIIIIIIIITIIIIINIAYIIFQLFGVNTISDI